VVCAHNQDRWRENENLDKRTLRVLNCLVTPSGVFVPSSISRPRLPSRLNRQFERRPRSWATAMYAFLNVYRTLLVFTGCH
jgi:hypothetical protein